MSKNFLQVAAERRAKIIAVLKEHGQEPVTAGYLQKQLDNESDLVALKSLLYSMAKAGTIGHGKEKGQAVYFSKSKAAPAEGTPRKETKPSGMPAMSIEYVKSTGRARVTVGGIVLEIGVVES